MFNIDKSIKNIIGKSKVRDGKKDWDGDGIINSKDCQPRNTMRQDNIKNKIRVGQTVNTEDFFNGKVISKDNNGIKIAFIDPTSRPARQLYEKLSWRQVEKGLNDGWLYLVN